MTIDPDTNDDASEFETNRDVNAPGTNGDGSEPGTIDDVKVFRFGEDLIRAVNEALAAYAEAPDGEDLSAYKLDEDTLMLLIPSSDGRALVGLNETGERVGFDELDNFKPRVLDSAGILYGEGSCIAALSLGGGYTVVKGRRPCRRRRG